MIYTPRHETIEAERVLLGGTDLVAVAVDGAAHLVDGEVFRLFFGLAPGRKCFGGAVSEEKPRKARRANNSKRAKRAKRMKRAKRSAAAEAPKPHEGIHANGNGFARQRNGKPSLIGLVLHAVSEGPKDISEICDWITKRDAGLDADVRPVSSAVWNLIYQKRIQKDGEKYILAPTNGAGGK